LTLAVSRRKVGPKASQEHLDVPASEEERIDPIERPPRIVRWTLRLEQARALDRPVHAVEPSIRTAFGTGVLGGAIGQPVRVAQR
jgi:hypothetical protein